MSRTRGRTHSTPRHCRSAVIVGEQPQQHSGMSVSTIAQRGMDLLDAASRPTNRPRKRDIVRAQAVGSRFQARGLLDPRDDPLQVAE